jgi:hypothetical protein
VSGNSGASSATGGRGQQVRCLEPIGTGHFRPDRSGLVPTATSPVCTGRVHGIREVMGDRWKMAAVSASPKPKFAGGVGRKT